MPSQLIPDASGFIPIVQTMREAAAGEHAQSAIRDPQSEMAADPPLDLPVPPPHVEVPINTVFEDRVEHNLAAHGVAREASYGTRYSWQKTPLEPFSLARRNLFWRLRELDAPVIDWEEEISKRSLFLTSALKLLWLMHQPDDVIQAIRDGSMGIANVFAAIDAWSDLAVPPSSEADACALVVKILADVAAHSAQPAPHPGNPQPLGNAPGPSSQR